MQIITPQYSAIEQQWIHEGFAVQQMRGRFVPAMARVFFRPDVQYVTYRVEVVPDHCNGLDIAHGGFLSTMADIMLGYNVGHVLPKKARFVTSNLSVDFLQPVKAGAWLESEIDRIKIGTRLCHASGALLSDGRAAVAMRATFALIP